jgi:ribosomal protein S18 acetylase RimI-like enzyme
MSGVHMSASLDGLSGDDMKAFFVGWPNPPSPDQRAAILRAADEVIVARSDDGTVIGFVTAITDGVFAAYIPLLEVIPACQHQGIGSMLITAMLDRLKDCYMIDLVCDDDVVPFYERLGGTRLNAVAWRNFDRLPH